MPYISSLPPDAERIARAVRNHWAVVNWIHWCLELQFNEDQSRVRGGYADNNLVIVRRIEMKLLRLNTTRKASIKSQRMLAATIDGFRAEPAILMTFIYNFPTSPPLPARLELGQPFLPRIQLHIGFGPSVASKMVFRNVRFAEKPSLSLSVPANTPPSACITSLPCRCGAMMMVTKRGFQPKALAEIADKSSKGLKSLISVAPTPAHTPATPLYPRTSHE